MNNGPGKILVIDDDEDILLATRFLLRKHSFPVHTEKDPGKIPVLLRNNDYDVILLDMNFAKNESSGKEGFYWLDRIFDIDPSAVVILITAYGDVEMAVRAIKEGATDFILKPWQNEKLLATVGAALNLRKSRLEADKLRAKSKQLSHEIDREFGSIIGISPPMQKLFEIIEKVASTEANVLILGENGTGKELVAREIHRRSGRGGEVFINVDIGAISETLFESELFGHVKGAFTDASEHRPGRFEVASGGTLFLDEIGNIPERLQIKLLTVLQNRQVTRLGSNRNIDIDIRLICASNMPVHHLVAEKQFRRDLFYRINTVEISLPPLRERREDITLLAEHFVRQYGERYGKPLQKLGTRTINMLQRHTWPGNVRELQHALERAVIMSNSQTLQPEDFMFSPGRTVDEELQLDDYNLENVERVVILRAMDKHQGNISRAARELGLTRSSLYRRIEKYGL